MYIIYCSYAQILKYIKQMKVHVISYELYLFIVIINLLSFSYFISFFLFKSNTFYKFKEVFPQYSRPDIMSLSKYCMQFMPCYATCGTSNYHYEIEYNNEALLKLLDL